MKVSLKVLGYVSSFVLALIPGGAEAMDLDWSGQFRSEAVIINNYAPESYNGTPGTGYTPASGGSRDAKFQTLFLRLRPKLIVNDNVAIKSEWWLGNPVTGFYGSAYPGSDRPDQRYFNSSFSGGSVISAQRFWGEFLTDLGTFQVGRAPLHWGLGVVYHSGDGLYDRYQSTGDTYRMIAKFGNFSLIPAHTKFSMGNAVGGTCIGTTCAHPPGGASFSDYTLGLRYENLDEDFEGGVQLIRRVADAQTESGWINGVTGGGMNLTIWDIYAKKRMGKFEFGVEAPIISGDLVGFAYKSFALALELKFKANDSWNFLAKAGKVPGQPNSAGTTPEKWKMVYFHPNYRLGLLLFNYNFGNFAGPNVTAAGTPATIQSIYDDPITNANYAFLGGSFTADKWKFSGAFVTATADETAQAGQSFFNSRTRSYSATPAQYNQSSSLGTEVDLGVALLWDEYTTFSLDAGMLFQGGYYKFGNGTADNDLSPLLGVVGSVGVQF